MEEYTKINTVWKRDERGLIIEGDYATPEIEYLAALPWQWTEKVDGTNVRIGWDGERLSLGGRTEDAQLPTKLIGRIGDMDLAHRLDATGIGRDERKPSRAADVVLYGEGYGAGIQSGGIYRDTQSVVLFDVKIGGWWLRRADVEDVADKLLMDVVPVVAVDTIAWACGVVRAGLPSSWNPAVNMEGLVGRPLVDLFDRRGDRLLVKVKTRDYTRLAKQPVATPV